MKIKFTKMQAFGNDYVYSDTDSVKVINAEKHKEYIVNVIMKWINKELDKEK